MGSAPNVICILIDDLGYRDLGCYGSDLHETPIIDQLGRMGMIFTNAYSAAPVCSPTRASLLTGKPPVSTGITEHIREKAFVATKKNALIPPQNGVGLALDETTIAEILKARGYSTAIVGKWHLGGEAFGAIHQGFDHVVAASHRGSTGSYFYPYANTIPDLVSNGKPGEYLTDRLTQEAIHFIDSKKQSPFFLYLSYYAVHIPLQAKEQLQKKYEKKVADKKPVHHRNARYAAMVETVDTNVGLLMAYLKKEKLLDNTLIILTSDNGGLSVKEGANTPSTDNFPLRDGKGFIYEGGIRVPLIVYWQGKVKANSTSAFPIVTYDLLTTISSVCGFEKPMPWSVDFSPIFLAQKELKERPIFWHSPHYSNQGGRPAAAIRMGKYKLIRQFEGPTLELYNLNTDIGEQKNIADVFPAVRDSLNKMLGDWLKETDAKMPIPNPAYEK